MITITRLQARQVRTVFRRALHVSTKGPFPTLMFQAGPDGLRIRAMTSQAAAEYHIPGQFPPEQLAAPYELLADCEGSKSEPVGIEAQGDKRQTLIARWQDNQVPQVLQYDAASPAKAQADKFPPWPDSWTENPPGLLKALAESWDEAAAEEGVAFASADEEQALRRQTAELVVAYLAQVPEDEPRPLAVEAMAEAPLVDPATGEDFGIPLVGIMDLVLDDRAGPVIADFKTAARGGEPLEITHEIQLSAYAYLFRQTSAKEEAGLEIRSLVKTKTPKIECHHYGVRTGAHFRRLFAVIRAYLDDLDAGRFVFRPGWGCGMCDYRQPHCRQWCG